MFKRFKMVRFLFVFFLFFITTASAGIIIPNLDQLSPQEQEGALRFLISPKHYSEKENVLKADFRAAFPGKNIDTAYWVPDTLLQTVETFLTTGLFDNGNVYIKHLKHASRHWKRYMELDTSGRAAERRLNRFKYPNTVEKIKNEYKTLLSDWVKINRVTHRFLEEANFHTEGSQPTLTKILRKHPISHLSRGLANIIGVEKEKTKYLKDNESLLRNVIQMEEKAHREGKLLLWRYVNLLPGRIPDLPFMMHGNLNSTLQKPLTYRKSNVSKGGISYAQRFLDGYIGDGWVFGKPFCSMTVPGCTFSFMANDTAMRQKGLPVENAMLYSVALTSDELNTLNNKRFLYYPKDAMPSFMGIYGTEEGFHPHWTVENLEGSPQPYDKASVEAWLKIMASDALQLHFIDGQWKDHSVNNPDLLRIRRIYEQFYNKATSQSTILEEKTQLPVVPPVKKQPPIVINVPPPIVKKTPPLVVKKAPLVPIPTLVAPKKQPSKEDIKKAKLLAKRTADALKKAKMIAAAQARKKVIAEKKTRKRVAAPRRTRKTITTPKKTRRNVVVRRKAIPTKSRK